MNTYITCNIYIYILDDTRRHCVKLLSGFAKVTVAITDTCVSKHASALMRYHLEREAISNLCAWYARVPTEADVSDFPSRNVPFSLLVEAPTNRCIDVVQQLAAILAGSLAEKMWGKPVSNSAAF